MICLLFIYPADIAEGLKDGYHRDEGTGDYQRPTELDMAVCEVIERCFEGNEPHARFAREERKDMQSLDLAADNGRVQRHKGDINGSIESGHNASGKLS